MQQIIDRSLPFEVSLIKCYKLFGATWVQFADLEENREAIIETLLLVIPPKVYEYGQCEIEIDFEAAELPDYPETIVELLKEHSHASLLSQLSTSLQSYNKSDIPKYIVKKEHLKPVNPNGNISDIYRDDTMLSEKVRLRAVKNIIP